jgi:hypothetical protein
MPAELGVFYGLVKPVANRVWLAGEPTVKDLYKGGRWRVRLAGRYKAGFEQEPTAIAVPLPLPLDLVWPRGCGGSHRGCFVAG